MRIVSVCGSLNAGSGNLTLLEDVAKSAIAAQGGLEFMASDHLRALPHFSPDLVTEDTPQSVIAWRNVLAEADAVLIASPEYGHSLPGVLKNGIDWLIGSGELHQKNVAITAAVGHNGRGLLGLAALKTTLLAIDVRLLWETPIVTGIDRAAQIEALLATFRSIE